MATLPRPDFTFIRSDSDSIELTFTDADSEPINLTGAVVSLTVKPNLIEDGDDRTALLKKDITSHSNPTQGETIIDLTPEDLNIPPGTYFYDIQVQNGEEVFSIVYRSLEIIQDVTRRYEESYGNS